MTQSASFSVTYFYERQDTLFKRIFLLFISILLMYLWAGILLKFSNGMNFNMFHYIRDDFGQDLFFFIAIPLLASIIFPYGLGSIYVDNNLIKIIPYKFCFNIIFPIRSTFNFDNKIDVEYNKTETMICFSDEKRKKIIYMNGTNEGVRKAIIQKLKDLSVTNKNISLSIEEE